MVEKATGQEATMRRVLEQKDVDSAEPRLDENGKPHARRLTDQFGLILNVAPGGSKQWVWRGTIHGKRREAGLGSVKYITLDEARETAFDYTRTARLGGDPRPDRAVKTAAVVGQVPGASSAPALRQMAETHIEAVRGLWKNPAGQAADWRSRFERYIWPSLGDRPVDQITVSDVRCALEPLYAEQYETARKLKIRLGAVLDRAVEDRHRPDNPAKQLKMPKRPKRVERHKSLPYHELGPALEKIAANEEAYTPARHCLLFAVAAACRSGEAREATWDEIDLDARVWVIPAARTKTGEPHRVPLSSMAMEVLEAATVYSDSGLVFPAPRGGIMHSAALNTLPKALGLGFTPHGCRASFRSWAAETGENGEHAEMALAHSLGQVERAYQRSDLLEARRGMMQRWADALSG